MAMSTTLLTLHVNKINEELKKGEYDDGKIGNSTYRFRDEMTAQKIELQDLCRDEATIKAAEKVLTHYAGLKGTKSKHASNVLSRMAKYKTLIKNPEEFDITNLQDFQDILKATIGKTEHKWLFQEREDGQFVAYLVNNVQYHAPREYQPANVQVSMLYYKCDDDKFRQEKSNLYFYLSDISKERVSISALLEKKGYYLETPDMYSTYQQEAEALELVSQKLGTQYWADNKGISGGRYSWQTGFVLMQTGGTRHKIVVDSDGDSVLFGNANSPYWGEEELELPTHPYIKCYDLTSYRHVWMHISNMEEYEYDASVKEKLVLPKSDRSLLDVLIDNEESLMEDIVKGKTGGIIVIATGEAGLGKTLTSEVYSEIMEKPLYVVQSAQLGINVSEVEGNLKEILQRASRWNAILMIDEADTYIHKRGDNLEQNCIVGVFLRLLEYYKGVLFMTSNRPDIIDDAIMSRATAHIHYDYPPKEDLKKIWKILSTQFNIPLPESEIDRIIDTYPFMAGRDVKNTLKLMGMIHAKTEKKCTLELMQELLPFMNFRHRMEVRQSQVGVTESNPENDVVVKRAVGLLKRVKREALSPSFHKEIETFINEK